MIQILGLFRSSDSTKNLTFTMNRWGRESIQRRKHLHSDLIHLSDAVLPVHDCTVVYGLRTLEEQSKLFSEGLSQTMDSMHLARHPETGRLLDVEDGGVSWAIDLSPYPIDWEDIKRFYYFAGRVLQAAYQLSIPIRWGGDWDRDQDLNDQTFMDLVHFELVRRTL